MGVAEGWGRPWRVSIAEIEFVLAHSETYIVPERSSSAYEPRFIAIGRSPSGKYAFVVFTLRERNGRMVLRPISARYMHKKEIETYEKENPDL